jgi:pseudouridine-5'-phosphate glycosidase
MDISSDITALGRTPIAVICAGVKSILDIPRTLEYLVSNSFGDNITEIIWHAL